MTCSLACNQHVIEEVCVYSIMSWMKAVPMPKYLSYLHMEKSFGLLSNFNAAKYFSNWKAQQNNQHQCTTSDFILQSTQ